MTDQKTDRYHYGTGRRKTSVARVRLVSDNKKMILNGAPHIYPSEVFKPLILAGKSKEFGIEAKVLGGGYMAQIIALRHGVARALVAYDAELRVTLKKAGYLKRDPRETERKKPGLKKARRAPQWSKR
ncbi:30S ribosomal protein S9 [Candidatus Berkelbacteria bacterium RIFOXYA2_FULL_43_10]|uniref:30S ribosomal protein S9 n=1 Tax=Candidatus Berkelbacteria bacterium RIFOXYA2_FULL_43_10 TaxID=1797472 RepID=A0A1F5EAG2_9BACT|nr:MAG: 30S ribosomal protein S9 [Candidatus Berkelbacteria bacterium RIFOXYA2_FULL_43_10]